MTNIFLLPKRLGVNIHPGDRLYFLGDKNVEVVRDGEPVALVKCAYMPVLPLAKKAGDWQEGERIQPNLLNNSAEVLTNKQGEKVEGRKTFLSKEESEAKQGKGSTGSSSEDDEGDEKKSKLPPGARWITIHPHGEDEPGVPIIIQEHPDGTAHVIGGAGGKLNMLHLNNMKSPDEWKERAKKKKDAEKERVANQTEEERQTEATEKAKAKEYHLTQTHQNALSTLQALEQHGVEHGLSAEHKLALQQAPDPGAEPEKIEEWQSLTKDAIARVKAIHQAYEHKLTTDHEARAAAFLGDGGLDANKVIENRSHTVTDADGGEAASLIQLPNGQWLARTEGDSQVFDDWQDAAKAHVRNVNEFDQQNGGDRSQPDEFYDPRQWVRESNDELLPEGFEFNAAVAGDIAKLSAERKQQKKDARSAERAIERGSPFVAGYAARVSEISQREVLDKLESEAKTLQDAFTNDDFLRLVGQSGDPEQMRGHVQTGGYSKLAEIASDVLKQNPVSPALVDALGHNEAAKVLAYQMRQVLSPDEYDRATAAQAAYHAQTSARIAKATTEKVQPMMERLKELHEQMIQLDEAAGGDLSPEQQIQMDTLNYDARSLQREINKTLGSTLGQLQASAAMVAALEGKPKTLKFSGDAVDRIENLIPGMVGGDGDEPKETIFDHFGVGADDFQLQEDSEGTKGVQLNESGLQKLAAQGYDPEDTEAYNRALAIKRGDTDEADFVPNGFAYRAKASFTDAGTDANQFDTKFEVLERLAQADQPQTMSLFGDPEPSEGSVTDEEIHDSLRSYIGSRVANGENPLDVMNDVRSPEFYAQQGLDPYGDGALRVQNLASDLVKQLAGGDRISDKAITQAFQSLGDAEAAKQRRARQTDDLQTLHAQTLDHESAVEAGHRTLAAMPMARTVFKSWDQLNGRERKWLRDYAITEVLGQELDPPKPKKQASDDALSEVAEEQYDLFGNKISAAEALGQEDEPEAFSQWQSFSKLMGGDAKAYAAVRDHLRGKFMNRFASAYGAIAGKPMLIGGEKIQHVDRLLLAKMPEEQRNEMLEFIRSRDASDVAKVRARSGGKFAAEIDADWLAKYEELKGDNRQISLLSADTGRSSAKTDYQRTTLGNGAEAQLHEAMQAVLPNFAQVDSAVDIYPEVNWGGDTAHATKQRALKFLEAQKKVGIHFGAGSGKTSIMLGSFTHLHSQGKVKRMIVAVPSSILGQFVGEAATFLKPGTYNVNANLNWDREQRLAALADPNNHVHVTTRESLSNDLLHLVEKHHGVNADQFQEMPESQHRELIHSALKAEGIDPEHLMLSVDEAHDILSRKGVDPSKRSQSLNALGFHSQYYMQATGSPIKNDLSEMYAFLHSVAPEKFNNEKDFLKRYGSDTQASRRALQRAIAPYSFAASTKPQDKAGRTLKMNEKQPVIPVGEHQAKERQRILDDAEIVSSYLQRRTDEVKAQLEAKGESRLLTTEDFSTAWDEPTVRDAIGRLGSADTWGGKTDEEKQASIGGQVRAIGALKQTALWRMYHRTPYEQNGKAQHVVNMVRDKIKKEGQAGVVFSSSSQAAAMLKEQMAKQGIRVGLIDGSLNAEQKSSERLKFSPAAGGKPEYDVLICTDAAQTGLNLTRGKFLVHYDVPLTMKAYEQRSARIHRLKQDVDTEIHTPMFDAPEERIAWARMQRKGATASPLQSKAELLDDTGLAAMIERMRAGESSSLPLAKAAQSPGGDKNFQESDHPRDAKGRFTQKSESETTESQETKQILGSSILKKVKQRYGRFRDVIETRQKRVGIILFDPPDDADEMVLGRHEAAAVSMRQKVKTFEFLGSQVDQYRLSYYTSAVDFSNILSQLNEDESCTGIIVQFPLPQGLRDLLSNISTDKDLDVLGKNHPLFPTCATADGIARLVEPFAKDGETVAVVGAKGFVGGGVAKILKQKNIKLMELDLGDDLLQLRDADVIVSAVGQPEILDERHLSPSHKLVVDSGFTPIGGNIYGDIKKSACNIAQNLTPVPGGVGPVEMAILTERLVQKEVDPNVPLWSYPEILEET